MEQVSSSETTERGELRDDAPGYRNMGQEGRVSEGNMLALSVVAIRNRSPGACAIWRHAFLLRTEISNRIM
jgi:hypothetical protein